MTAAPGTRTAPPRREITGLLVALVLAIALSIALGIVTRTGVLATALTGAPRLLVADLCVWVPLLLGVWWCIRGGGRSGLRYARLGLRRGGRTVRGVPPLVLDVVLGVVVALVARVVDLLLTVSMFGTTGLQPMPVLLGGSLVALAAMQIIGPGIVSPIVEELFFRGALQRGLAGRYGQGFWGQTGAVLVAAFVFALAHVVLGSGGGASVSVYTTFVLGLLTGAVVAATGRLWGALVAHLLFNLIAVALTWPY